MYIHFFSSLYVVRHHVTRIKLEIILIAQEARKTLGETEFQAFHHFFFGGRGKVIGILYINLKHRIWRVQICQKGKYCFSDIIWLSWWRTTYIHVHVVHVGLLVVLHCSFMGNNMLSSTIYIKICINKYTQTCTMCTL